MDRLRKVLIATLLNRLTGHDPTQLKLSVHSVLSGHSPVVRTRKYIKDTENQRHDEQNRRAEYIIVTTCNDVSQRNDLRYLLAHHTLKPTGYANFRFVSCYASGSYCPKKCIPNYKSLTYDAGKRPFLPLISPVHLNQTFSN